MARGILLAAMDFTNVAEDEFTIGMISNTYPNGNGYLGLALASVGLVSELEDLRRDL